MKQRKTLQELGRELQRQLLNRQDFPAETRSPEMESDFYGSVLNLSLEGKSLSFTVGKRYINKSPLVFILSISGLVKIPNDE